MKIYCLIHSFYKGETPPPSLTCKACCKIFLSEIKRKHENGEVIPKFDFNSFYNKPALKKKRPWLFSVV